ncbi:MAG: sodium-dependent transporter [Phycisphaerae bacterium]
MSEAPELDLAPKEKWGSKFGVILAVAGSAVGLGNFLRFPGQAVNNGGGAFMIPYIISFLVLGIPIAWCEWTMGRLGGRYHQNSAPGVMYALWRRAPAKAIGAMTLLIPVVIYMYYVLLEAWCLDYCVEFAKGGFAEMFGGAVTKAAAAAPGQVVDHVGEVDAVVGATGSHFATAFGMGAHGALFQNSRLFWIVLFCFLVNFTIIYMGVTRGIEVFCKWAMPALIMCAVIILCRVLTLPGISTGLGFMWNPQWDKLGDVQVWLAAAGQIFFSLSVGFGLILCYSSYLRSNDDVVLTSLSASSTNEFCEVILGGLIVVPTAFLFLGTESAKAGTFGLGFVTVPAIMHFMPGGDFFGALWFGLLFLAAVTSSLSMLQPAIAFLEDGFGLRRRGSVALLGVITAIGAGGTMYFSKGLVALDHTDFWCNLLMIVAATCQVLIFGWVIGADKGVKEMNRGADFAVPRCMPFVIRYVTPAFLLLILGMWSYEKFPGYLDQMNPETQAAAAEHGVYRPWVEAHVREAGMSSARLDAAVADILGPEAARIDSSALPAWLASARVEIKAAGETRRVPIAERAAAAAADAASLANVARFVFGGVVLFFILLVVLSDIACRNRIGATIREAERQGATWETA